MRKLYFLLIIIWGALPVYSIDSHWDTEPVVIKNGVNNNTIYDVCIGSDGFMWLTTDMGLSRYDGFRFRDYPLIMSIDSLTTPLHQPVRTLREASDGLYYALLFQGGISCFDKDKEKFLPVTFSQKLKQGDVVDFQWMERDLYLATTQGLYQTKTMRNEDKEGEYISCIVHAEPLVKGKIEHLCTDGKANLYFTVDGKKVMQYDLAQKKASVIKEYSVVNKLLLRNGYLWICRLWNDIICYDLEKKKEGIVSMGDVGKFEFTNSYIADIVFKDPQTVYLATWDGLFKLKFEKEDLCESPYTLTRLTQNEKAFRSNIENKMTSLVWDDNQQILWVGTFGGGVVKFDVSDSMYSRVRQDLKARVGSMVEDNNGYVWLSMTDGGIMKSSSPHFTVDTRFEPWNKASGLTGCYLMFKGKNGNIWLGNNRGEIVTIDPLKDAVDSFRLQTDDGENMQVAIRSFCMDSWNRLWMGTSDGLIRVDTKSHACKKINLPGGVKEVFSVAEDKEGNIWLGTDKGLKRLEFVGEQIKIEGGYEKQKGLEEAGVRTIYVNNYNQIYAAYLNVVIRIDGRDKDNVESVYTLKHGLTNGHVGCMIDDHIGNTWAGNNVGVMTIRNGQEAFYNYLAIGNCSAVCRLNDGRLLWANSWGLFYFDPSLTKADSGKTQLMLTDMVVSGDRVLAGDKRNGQVILTEAPEKQEKLVFSPQNRDFHLYFSDLRYGMTQRKMAYRLLPDDKEWKIIPLQEGVWYNGLSAGKYTLQAKLAFPDGREGEMVQIPIVVQSHWYLTLWAYVVYVLLLAALGYFCYVYFKKRDMRRQLHINREMLLRENLSLEKVKQLQRKEMDAMRNRLLMMFVQELRTPLSLIIAPLKDLQKDISHAQNLSLQVAYRNALRMIDACEQLSSIYGQGNLTAKLKVAPYSVEKMVDSNLLGVRELLKVYSIDFRCEKRIRKELEFYVDKKKIEFIIHNLMTNAFTHTHYAGVVSLTVCEIVENGVHYVSLTVEDDGDTKVITTEQLLNSGGGFDGDMSTAQLGYTIMEQMVKAHHGTIALESDEKTGTKVTVNIPTDKSVFDEDPKIEMTEPEELTEQPVTEPDEPKTEAKGMETVQPIVAQPLPEENAAAAASATKKTILIVEDHKDIRLYLKVLFGNEYNLLMATNGQEGVDMAMKEMPDLIICDVMMPVKDGFECCREVKEGLETCSIPFIMLTAKVEDDDIIRGLEMGADDYVLKPFTPGILKAKVRNLISGRQTLKQMYTKLFKLPGTDTVVDEEQTEESVEEVKAEDPFISSVIKIIEENICEADFSVKKLASEMNMSQPTLYRKVKQSTDYTIIELIRGVRMRRAGVLLKTKQHAVQEVAEMVGYNDIPTFRKHFVDAFGTTPSTYE